MSERRSELKAVPTTEASTKQAQQDFAQATTRFVEGLTEVNSRLIALAQTSLRSGLDAAEQLRQVQNPADFLGTQLKLTRQAYDTYLDESRKIGEVVARLSSDAFGSIGLPR